MKKKKSSWAIEVYYKPAVTDPSEDSIKKGILDLDIKGVSSVKSVHKYIITGNLKRKDIERIACELLSNPVVQNYKIFRINDRRYN
jgi:phosphoribosylformylglycinamidine (FGAM) synthase PurS component